MGVASNAAEASEVRHDRHGARWCTNEPQAKTCRPPDRQRTAPQRPA